ncbi:MAG: 50S ribosome-binding GTPase [Planctomycetales bacterium]|nr:50S ribosome-binding GTPase [Planctomycetales bacterium]
MIWKGLLRPRPVVLSLMWLLPTLVYLGIGLLALYQTGWLLFIGWTLPLMWLAAWAVAKVWSPPRLGKRARGKPLTAPQFWTPEDTRAIEVVEQFRTQVADVDRWSIVDYNRYVQDAQTLAEHLARHYHAGPRNHALHALSLVEIFAVIHLAVEDMETWILENVPGSSLATIGHWEQLPTLAKMVNTGQTVAFLATVLSNPAKLLAYPLWKASGNVTEELQNELLHAFYQRYLRQVGFYLIEMYSGRLRGGAQRYRQQFGQMSAAVHAASGQPEVIRQLEATNTRIAVMGQVKAGKSSLINALIGDRVAATSLLPETRQVQQFEYTLPGTEANIFLLDTPGYDEVDVSKHQRREIQLAADQADIVLLVMDIHSAARESDLRLVQQLAQHYAKQTHLKPPPIIAVLTHIDQLRPLREWKPPYHWRKPASPKEHSIANAVAYVRELFGSSLAGYACVYTGDAYPEDSTVADELVPQLLEHLDQGHATAVLKAFYQQLSTQRLQQLTRQLSGLLKSVARTLLDNARNPPA